MVVKRVDFLWVLLYTRISSRLGSKFYEITIKLALLCGIAKLGMLRWISAKIRKTWLRINIGRMMGVESIEDKFQFIYKVGRERWIDKSDPKGLVRKRIV